MRIGRAAAVGLCLSGMLLSQPLWRVADPEYRWSFPRDHWAHSGYKTEWWYFTGHLKSRDDPRRRFGYQFTFFRVGLGPAPPEGRSAWTTGGLVMGHAAVTDLSSGKHTFSELLYREIPLLGGFSPYPEPRIGWSRGPAGTEDLWELFWNGEGFDFRMADNVREIAFDLSTRPLGPLVLQGPNGYSRKGTGASAASQYYSLTRMGTEGRLTLAGETHRVAGESWMDKEFGSNQLASNQVGWDWFSLQFEDGRELMLYQLRDAAGATDFARGTLVTGAGSPRYLDPGEWRVEILSHWTSPKTGARYPSSWRVELDGGGFTWLVRPLAADQENRSELIRDFFYWEGAVEVADEEGNPVGKGYVELTGYGTGTRPPV